MGRLTVLPSDWMALPWVLALLALALSLLPAMPAA